MLHSCSFKHLFVALSFTPLAYTKPADPWSSFNRNIKACTVVGKVYEALPSSNQQDVLNYCNSFVGYSITSVTGQIVDWVTSPIPLKTITVSANPRPRYAARAEDDMLIPPPQPASPSFDKVTPTAPFSTITPAPEIPEIVKLHPELKRAVTKAPTPALFKNQASLYIRTGCACLGFSTPYTLPIFTTTTTTSTVPVSCARAPFSAYHVASYGPASAVAAAYEYGWFDYQVESEPWAECCKDCQERGGCVQFTWEPIDPAEHFGNNARCNFYYLDEYNAVTGVPALASDLPYKCPYGYLAVNGLTKDTSSTTMTKATFLGPCAVSTVRK
ncbi:hypothetical protein FB567DRAFT_510818 [Paraphoma chrysanthemicola]|uniref:Apple domain-containing protein n=1 Tax=Paraphoma chrysanthemicola TaxID=798071 RepID=A0A8K0RK38_9PLEO|nr:hypothetical protein FB567DRAFT_510818 [Paraphoma chrysanthemicola]